jgi:thiamine kinase-like enzyme
LTITAHEVIAYGRTAEILVYGNGQVLKLFRAGMPLDSIEEEFRIASTVYHAGVTTPEPFEMIDFNGRMGIVYQKAIGQTMLSTFSKKPWTIRNGATRMAKLHASMHSRHVLELPNQKEMLTARIDEAPLLTMEEKQKIKAHLNDLRDDSKLCHGDFHPDNIIVGASEWVFDWMTGMVGNPAGDVARTMILLKLGTMPDETPKLRVYLFAYLRNQIVKYYTQAYLKNSTISLKEIEQWIVPVAAARLCEWIPEKEKQAIVKLIRNEMIS